MISDVSAVMRKQETTIRADEKVGRHLRHLEIGPSPETATHRADPVPVEARKEHRLEESGPRGLDSEGAVDLLIRIRDERKRIVAPTRIPSDRPSRRVEERDSRQAAGL